MERDDHPSHMKNKLKSDNPNNTISFLPYGGQTWVNLIVKVLCEEINIVDDVSLQLLHVHFYHNCHTNIHSLHEVDTTHTKEKQNVVHMQNKHTNVMISFETKQIGVDSSMKLT